MGSRSVGGSKEPRWKTVLQKIVKAVIEWEDEQHKRQKRKGQNERDQQR